MTAPKDQKLVEELRAKRVLVSVYNEQHDEFDTVGTPDPLCIEAASTIERLSSEFEERNSLAERTIISQHDHLATLSHRISMLELVLKPFAEVGVDIAASVWSDQTRMELRVLNYLGAKELLSVGHFRDVCSVLSAEGQEATK